MNHVREKSVFQVSLGMMNMEDLILLIIKSPLFIEQELLYLRNQTLCLKYSLMIGALSDIKEIIKSTYQILLF